MRIILSRKGFDSSYGGVPSPILPDGRLLSLPIPLSDALTYEQVTAYGANLGDVVARLTKGRVGPHRRVHLDPDLRSEALARAPGWLPAFGQADAAARHLQMQGIREGDLFLFFGWFRQTEGEWPDVRYVRNAPDMHVLFGWLQVGSIIEPDVQRRAIPEWLRYHPHIKAMSVMGKHNVIFVASPRLTLRGKAVGCAGGGSFLRFSERLRLTHPEALKRSAWRLPKWFAGEPWLTYHRNQARWTTLDEYACLRTVARGQEFVLDCTLRPAAESWIKDLFEAHTDAPTACSGAGP